MELVNKTITLEDLNEPLKIVPISDVHLGSVNCNLRKFKETVNYIKNTPNCYTVLLGDLCEAIMISDKRFNMADLDPIFHDRINDLGLAQYEMMRDILMPIKHKILAGLAGNHDATMKLRYHSDFCAWLHRELGCPDLGDSGFLVINWDPNQLHREKVILYCAHGFFAGRRTGSKVNNMEELAKSYEADLYLLGHSHALFVTSTMRVYPVANKIKLKKQYFCQTGSYLDTLVQGSSCYAERAGYVPQKTGSLKISIYPRANGIDYHVSE